MDKRKTIFRSEKDRNYSVICNECFRNSSLSARAKGVFAYIMTLPDDWEIHKSELYNHFTEGRDAITGALKELEQVGYISRKARQAPNGQMMGWDYTVREKVQKPAEGSGTFFDSKEAPRGISNEQGPQPMHQRGGPNLERTTGPAELCIKKSKIERKQEGAPCDSRAAYSRNGVNTGEGMRARDDEFFENNSERCRSALLGGEVGASGGRKWLKVDRTNKNQSISDSGREVLNAVEKPVKRRHTEKPSFGAAAPTNYLSSENTDRRDVEKPAASRRSTGSNTNRKGPPSPSGAPWAGRSYSGVALPQIESYEQIEAILDPVLCAMAVTGERGLNGYGHWVSVLNGACASGMPLDMAVRVFRFCVSKVYGEIRAGEIVNPGAALNKELFGAFGSE